MINKYAWLLIRCVLKNLLRYANTESVLRSVFQLFFQKIIGGTKMIKPTSKKCSQVERRWITVQEARGKERKSCLISMTRTRHGSIFFFKFLCQEQCPGPRQSMSRLENLESTQQRSPAPADIPCWYPQWGCWCLYPGVQPIWAVALLVGRNARQSGWLLLVLQEMVLAQKTVIAGLYFVPPLENHVSGNISFQTDPVRPFPRLYKNEFRSFGQQIVIDFVRRIGGTVIVLMNAIEIKNDRYSFLAKRTIMIIEPPRDLLGSLNLSNSNLEFGIFFYSFRDPLIGFRSELFIITNNIYI